MQSEVNGGILTVLCNSRMTMSRDLSCRTDMA